MPASLQYLLMVWGIVTTVLTVLVIYGNTLSTREDDQIYLNKAEETMMASEQRVLVVKMSHLAHIIVALAILSGILLAASAGVWVWAGLYGS